MKTSKRRGIDFFNPLKIYNKNEYIIQEIENIIPKREKIYVPIATDSYYEMPICRSRHSVFNFVDDKYYEFWHAFQKNQDFLLEAIKTFSDFENVGFFELFEKLIYSTEDPIIKAVACLFLSRGGLTGELTSGPYIQDINKCFDESFYERFKYFSLRDIIITQDDPLVVCKKGFVLQTIPKLRRSLFHENHERKMYNDLLNNIKHGIVVSEGNNLRDKYKLLYEKEGLEILYMEQ